MARQAPQQALESLGGEKRIEQVQRIEVKVEERGGGSPVVGDVVEQLVIAMGGTSEARELVTKTLAYLSRYPSVGIIRFFDDVVKLTKARREVVARLLEAMRSIGVVEIVDGAVVNLKKRVDVKVRLAI